MKEINNELALLGFSYFQKIGPVKLGLLNKYFPNFVEAFLASSFDLEKAGLGQKLVSEFIVWRQKFNFDKALQDLRNENINFITHSENNYPSLLKELPSPPYLLYYQGDINNLNDGNKYRLAIVGSRKHSAYSEKIINEFVPDLISNNLEIISGLALGVDTLAHQKTLDNHGITIAVLGTGLDSNSLYPYVNRELAKRIINNNGLIVSEFPPGTQPLKQNFPQRNRIIAGLCQATLVIEAQIKSGSLITANYALDQNREVLAVPGNIYSEFSEGTNNLIRSGAKTILKAEDILEVFKIESIQKQKNKKQINKEAIFENEIEKKIYKIIQEAGAKGEVLTSDEIVKISKLDTALINSKLSILELRGIAKSNEIGYYIN
ncbi:MAG: DNA-processing protein DprA [Patescibacteria group bacterium]